MSSPWGLLWGPAALHVRPSSDDAARTRKRIHYRFARGFRRSAGPVGTPLVPNRGSGAGLRSGPAAIEAFDELDHHALGSRRRQESDAHAVAFARGPVADRHA